MPHKAWQDLEPLDQVQLDQVLDLRAANSDQADQDQVVEVEELPLLEVMDQDQEQHLIQEDQEEQVHQ
jgi:hypothetical protein